MKLQFGAIPSKEVLGYCDTDWGVVILKIHDKVCFHDRRGSHFLE